MKYIANIISKAKIEPFSDFVRVINDPDFRDYSVPTLIVGWEETKRRFPEANIIERRINENVFWTFSPRERRSAFEIDYDFFKSFVLHQCQKSIDYTYFSFFTEPCEACKKVLNYVKKGKSTLFIIRDMVYMLYKNKVIGFSLRDAEYIGIDKKKTLNYMKANRIIYGFDFLSDKDKRLFGGNGTMIPYLHSLTV